MTERGISTMRCCNGNPVYDFLDRLVELYLPDAETGEPVEDPSYVWVFDAASQLLTETDALGRTTEHQYDFVGREVATISNDPDGEGPLESAEWQTVYDAANRRVLSIAPNGGETAYEYDLSDNVVLIQLADPDGAGGAPRPELSFVYDAAGQLTSETDAMGRTTLHTLDNLGREIETEYPDPDGVGELEPSVWTRVFDAMSNLVLLVDPLENETAYQFDNLNRRTKIFDAEEGETSFTFDAVNNLASLTDPVGNTTTWFHDGLNRVIQEENELGHSRYFVYDEASNLVEKTDRNGRVTQYVVDRRGRTTEENWLAPGELSLDTTTQGSAAPTNEVQVVTLEGAVRGTFVLSFDGDTSEPLAFDADAQTVEGALEALTSIGSGNVSVSGSAGGPWTVTFQGALAATDVPELTGDASRTVSETILRSFEFAFDEGNQLLSAADPDAEYAFVYDGLGRTTQITADLAGFTSSIVMAQTFDVSSNRTRLAATIGSTADFVNDYLYDNLSRMSRIERQGQTGGNTVAETRIDLAYNAAGQFVTIDRYVDLAGTDLAVTTAYAYDGMGRLSTLDHTQDVTALAGYSFVYDAASRITEIDSLIDGLTAYNYDATSQLTAADFATQTDETHEWDPNGNPDETAFTIGVNNQILTDGTFNYTYDAEGNMVLRTNISTGETVAYVWDYRNRLTDVINRDDLGAVTQEVHYAYDFLNRWIKREIDEDGAGIEDPTTQWFAFDGYQVVLSFDDDEATVPDRRWLYGPSVDQYFAEEQVGDKLLLLLGDHLNTIRDTVVWDAIENETVLKNHTTYTSFNARANDTDTLFASFIGQTGRPHDPATGLDNHLNRWLNAWLKRWMSEDPIDFDAGDFNLQRFVSNRPTGATDPDGRQIKNLPPWNRQLDEMGKNGGRVQSDGTTSYQCTPRFGPFRDTPPIGRGIKSVFAWLHGFIASHELQTQLLSHYENGNGKEFHLTREDMIAIGPDPVSIAGEVQANVKEYGIPKAFKAKFFELKSKAEKSGKAQTEYIEFSRLSQAHLRATLGVFTINYRGKLTVYPRPDFSRGEFSFEGEMQFYDEYDFNRSSHREGHAERQVTVARCLTDGDKFKIVSPWVPFTESDNRGPKWHGNSPPQK